ncbi:MAG: cytochrome c oxidase subunit II [Candidatus Kapabacteria bacterium]|nr:cytochrome c oxidase subunit II [Candidatus Kapabacteria bacterium]
MFQSVSTYANNVDKAMLYIIYFSVFILIGVTIAMIIFAVKYNRKSNPKPEQIHGNTLLEITWVIIPTIIVISMFYVGIADYGVLRRTSKIDNTVHVLAYQWGWQFKYENGYQTEKIQAPDKYSSNYNFIPDTVFVPVNKVTKFLLNSSEVLHSFYLPNFRIKEDAVPKQESFVIIIPEKVGVWNIACAEYCGVKHSRMYSHIAVLSQADYETWFKSHSKKEADKPKEEIVTEKKK